MKLIDDIKRKGLRFAIRRFDSKYGLGALERLLFRNWFNPFLTIYVCLRSFPILQAIRLPMFVYGRPRIYGLSGQMQIEGKITMGMIRFNATYPGAPCVGSLQSEIINNGRIVYHGKCEIRTGCRIKTGENGILEFGSNTKICEMCNIGCYLNIKIGNTARIAHRSQILDSNYHYLANFEKHIVPNIKRPIEIGHNCWICNSSSISGGAKIPDFTIVASHSLVGKDFSNLNGGSLIGGIPAKLIANNIYRIWNKQMIHDIYKLFNENSETVFHLGEDTCVDDIL